MFYILTRLCKCQRQKIVNKIKSAPENTAYILRIKKDFVTIYVHMHKYYRTGICYATAFGNTKIRKGLWRYKSCVFAFD